MYRTVAEFTKDYEQESALTAKVLAALTDASLAQKVSADDRTLGRVAWHIALTLPEMLHRTGLQVGSLAQDAPLPSTAADILHAYESAAQESIALVGQSWKDETLAVEDDMYGQPWPRGLTLTVLLRHEIHHRGQMTVLMRQAGLRVPGVYGPAREDWASSGAPVPEV